MRKDRKEGREEKTKKLYMNHIHLLSWAELMSLCWKRENIKLVVRV